MKNSLLAGLTLAALIGLAPLLTGCGKSSNSSDQGTQQQQPPAVQIPTPPRVVIEPIHEATRRHIFDDQGNEIETQTAYNDGHSEDVKWRADRTQASYQVRNRTGQLTADLQYGADGKTIIDGYRRRDDGSLQVQYESNADGSITTTTYWWDGSSVFEIATVHPDGSYVKEMHHYNGALWQKRFGPNSTTVARQEEYDAGSGKLVGVLDESSGNTGTYTAYRPDGTVKFVQDLLLSSNGWSSSWKVMSVKEYAVDGKTVARHISISDPTSYNSYPGDVTIYNRDGTTVDRTLRSDGTVIHEETKDKDGKVVSQADHTQADNIKENIDSSLVSMQSSNDPESTWNSTESGPYYRSPAP